MVKSRGILVWVGGALGVGAAIMALLRTRLQLSQVEEWLERYDTFLFDCDGVIWRGDTEIPGVPDTIRELQRRGKKVIFVSNNATKHRSQYLQKFRAMQIEAGIDQVVTSAFVASRYFVGKYGIGAKVFCVGTDGLRREFEEAGAVDGVDPEIRAVVGAADWTLSHRKLSYAILCLSNIKGCAFIATNRDRLFPSSDGNSYPGAGAVIAALEYCASVKAVDMGKPQPIMLDILQESHGIKKSRAVMIGDRLDTDIRFGRKGGVDTCVVLTGCTTRRQVSKVLWGSNVPHYGLESFAEVGKALGCLGEQGRGRRYSREISPEELPPTRSANSPQARIRRPSTEGFVAASHRSLPTDVPSFSSRNYSHVAVYDD